MAALYIIDLYTNTAGFPDITSQGSGIVYGGTGSFGRDQLISKQVCVVENEQH